ncbi:MAG: HisA/HisF-related TIM barrel protein [Candidatus Dormibacteraceae bacterium]
MLIIPALDIRGGQVVRLRQGDFNQQTSYSQDPLSLAGEYMAAGVHRIHLVDLDAARGEGSNHALISQLIAELGVEVQVAGGIRTLADVEQWLASGAQAVVMGTTAVRQPLLLLEIAQLYPDRLLAALDVQQGRPAITGWSEIGEMRLSQLLEAWAEAPLAGIILTSIEHDGTLNGPDLSLLESIRPSTQHRLIYSGGMSRLSDLRAVDQVGAEAVILGKSLLEGYINLAEALAFSEG